MNKETLMSLKEESGERNAYRFIFLLSPAVFLVGVELSGEADADLRLALDGLQEDLPPSLEETL